jgi:hypothetical protein
MKPLDEIFNPDRTSLDIRVGPWLFGMSEEEYKREADAGLHFRLSALNCVESVPAHIRQNIELSKNLLLYSTYVFDFTTAAVHYSQIALDASLRRALGKGEACRDNIDMMLKESVSRNMLDSACHEHIVSPGFVSGSRNGLAHGKEGRMVLNQALAIPYVEMIVEAINALFSAPQSSVLK